MDTSKATAQDLFAAAATAQQCSSREHNKASDSDHDDGPCRQTVPIDADTEHPRVLARAQLHMRIFDFSDDCNWQADVNMQF